MKALIYQSKCPLELSTAVCCMNNQMFQRNYDPLSNYTLMKQLFEKLFTATAANPRGYKKIMIDLRHTHLL